MREMAGQISDRLNRAIEAIVAAIMLLLVVDVWLGVLERYLLHWQLPWPEELARYLMIWAAMLAVSCGIARREHIGLSILLDKLPEGGRRGLLIAMDALAFLLFFYVFLYGIGFAATGLNRQAMIFGMSLAPAFAAIPVAAAIAATQLALVLIRDLGTQHLVDQAEEV